MVAQFLESIGVSQRASRVHVLLLSALLLAGVMTLEWFQNLDYSLGVFYVLPVVLAATVLNLWQTLPGRRVLRLRSKPVRYQWPFSRSNLVCAFSDGRTRIRRRRRFG